VIKAHPTEVPFRYVIVIVRNVFTTAASFHLPRLEIWRHIRGESMEECFYFYCCTVNYGIYILLTH